MFPINILSQPPFVKNGFCPGSWITRTISRNLVDFALNADCQGNHATVQSTQSHRPLHISTKQIHEAHLIQNYIDWHVSNLMFIVGEKGGQNNGGEKTDSSLPRIPGWSSMRQEDALVAERQLLVAGVCCHLLAVHLQKNRKP